MEEIGKVGGADVLVDGSGHAPVVVVREAMDPDPNVPAGAYDLARLLTGLRLAEAQMIGVSLGVNRYEYRIPWDEEVERRVYELAGVVNGLLGLKKTWTAAELLAFPFLRGE